MPLALMAAFKARLQTFSFCCKIILDVLQKICELLCMLRVTERKSNGKRRVTFRGISRSARALGVTREHLWQVLTARRKSRRLLARYIELKGEL
jgi:hypothetical protein